MLKAIVILFFAAIWMFGYAMLNLLFKDRSRIKNRVETIMHMDGETEDEEGESSFFVRVIQPIYNVITKLLVRLTPDSKLNAMSKKLDMAGLLRNTTVEKFLYKKNMFMLIISFFMGVVIFYGTRSFLKSVLFAVLVAVTIQTMLRFYLAKRIEMRKKSILRDLPFTLDLILVSVEAGLSFDGAMARVINNVPGDISDEFAKALKETKMGIERKVALRNMSERCNIKELSTFVSSLIQADALGVSLGNILRIESEQMREHRRQSAREKAMKAPIKMLFPLILFIFPTIFVVVLGPAVIRIIEMMTK